jgi:hypothetical protein
VRAILLEFIRPMSLEDFHRLRSRERYDVSPAWVPTTCCGTRPEHRSHVAWVSDAWCRSSG